MDAGTVCWRLCRKALLSQGSLTLSGPCPFPGNTRSNELERFWWLTKDGDVDCLRLYEKHYSAYRYRDGRTRALFVGPGEKVVLRTADGDAFWVWRKFTDDCRDERTGERQAGVNCASGRAGTMGKRGASC